MVKYLRIIGIHLLWSSHTEVGTNFKMADDGVQSLITSFTGVTGADEERARFYLHAANWDLNTAIATYYESDEGDVDIVEGPNRQQQQQQQPEKMDTSKEETLLSSSKPTSKSSQNQRKSKFATLASYNQEEGSSEEEEGQAFYAGGSETSGQQIIGPNKKKENITQGIFDAAKSHGAQAVTDEPPRNSKSKNLFRGAGFTLGSNEDASKQVGVSLKPNEIASNDEPKLIVIKFWQNGFSIDDGPLRNPQDESNARFMDSIKKGEIPDELRQRAKGGEVGVNIEDHRTEDYVKPKQTLQAFTGKGHTLGSPTPNIVESEKPMAPVAAASAIPSQPTFKVDESKPVTTIQIRLSDGTRLVTKFNMDSTVGDIRKVVQNAKPGQGSFNLMTTFPNKLLTNDDDTIESANLKSAVIVQRMT